jgi:hypothetical protein
VNSLHWQGIASPADRIIVEGRADDGVIEAVSLKDHAGFALGAQWHPEFRVTENAIPWRFSRRSARLLARAGNSVSAIGWALAEPCVRGRCSRVEMARLGARKRMYD